jgi:hypothetical protein
MNAIPIVAVVFIALFVFALVREARKQRSGARDLFEQFAKARGWQFLEVDDGTVQEFASGMEAIGVFHSPSLGSRIPSNVILGRVAEGRGCLFQHSLRVDEGRSFEWHVCLIEAERHLCDSLVLRFLHGRAAPSNPFYSNDEIPLDPKWECHVVALGSDADRAAQLLRAETLAKLVEGADRLPWRVDLQVRGDRVAVYLAERNADPESPEDLARLLDFTRYAVRCLSSS